jgi:hypothetical protein
MSAYARPGRRREGSTFCVFRNGLCVVASLEVLVSSSLEGLSILGAYRRRRSRSLVRRRSGSSLAILSRLVGGGAVAIGLLLFLIHPDGKSREASALFGRVIERVCIGVVCSVLFLWRARQRRLFVGLDEARLFLRRAGQRPAACASTGSWALRGRGRERGRSWLGSVSGGELLGLVGSSGAGSRRRRGRRRGRLGGCSAKDFWEHLVRLTLVKRSPETLHFCPPKCRPPKPTALSRIFHQIPQLHSLNTTQRSLQHHRYQSLLQEAST